MSIDLYYLPPSPPCRSVMMLGKQLGINFNLKAVNVLKGEQLKPSFKKVRLMQSLYKFFFFFFLTMFSLYN